MTFKSEKQLQLVISAALNQTCSESVFLSPKRLVEGASAERTLHTLILRLIFMLGEDSMTDLQVRWIYNPEFLSSSPAGPDC